MAIFGSKKFGAKKIWFKKLILQKLGPKSLVRIGSVTTEIFLIWTNVARTNIGWTNIIMTVGIY